MPHIELPASLPGIRGPMAFSPETARVVKIGYTHEDTYFPKP